MQSVRRGVAGHCAQLEPVAAVCLRVSFGDGLGGRIGEKRLDGIAAHVAEPGYTQAAITTPSGARSEAASASASRPASRPSYPTKILRYMVGLLRRVTEILERTAPRAIRVNPHTLCGFCRSPGGA